ncbi:CC_3452 family protein [Sphingobium boeckii]|uniref:Uncharacterized protein n=1 Tax=Sphingobium boeckii TaxID=1082345 RepID=A0A7W9EF11_9SPHN|nr:hypothetical protein [Sphingobium boeckii]MBB5686569.1 hypothetical protein [Sphingobium boeckii]
MKRSSPIVISLFSAAITSVLLLTAAASSAATGGAYYAAKPIKASADARLVVRDTLWKCSDAGCASALKGNSRPAFVCESLVKEIGALVSFRAGQEEFSAEALAKCNAKA